MQSVAITRVWLFRKFSMDTTLLLLWGPIPVSSFVSAMSLNALPPLVQDSFRNYTLCAVALSLQFPLTWGSFLVFLCLYGIGIFGEQGHLFYRMLLSSGSSDVSTWLYSVPSEYPVNPIGNFSGTHRVSLHLSGPSDMPPSFWGGALCSFSSTTKCANRIVFIPYLSPGISRFSKSGVPSLSDLMPDALRWSLQ